MVSPEGSVSVDGVAICFMHCTLPILYYSHITQCPIALNFTVIYSWLLPPPTPAVFWAKITLYINLFLPTPIPPPQRFILG